MLANVASRCIAIGAAEAIRVRSRTLLWFKKPSLLPEEANRLLAEALRFHNGKEPGQHSPN